MPTVSRSSRTSTTRGCLAAWPRSRPAAADEVMTESAPLSCSRWRFSSSRAAATMRAARLCSRAVSVISTEAASTFGRDDDRRRVADPRALEDGDARRVADEPRVALLGRLLDVALVGVDDDDLARRHAMAAQRLERRPALGPVSADDRVVLQGTPPAFFPEQQPRPLGQHLQRRADEQDQEEDPGRGDEERGQQPRAVGDGDDVPVSGRRDAHGRVVDAVEQRDLVAGRVPVAVAVDVGDQRDEQRQRRAR